MATSVPERTYLTPGEAARILQVSPKTINRWANEGRIPCIVTLGGHRRFARAAINAAAEQMGAALEELMPEELTPEAPPPAARAAPRRLPRGGTSRR